MFTVANRLHIAEDFSETFQQRFQERVSSMREQPGFIRMQILKPVTEGAPHIVLTTWQDQASFKQWVSSENFAEAHANPLPKEAFTGTGSMEQHEIVVSSD